MMRTSRWMGTAALSLALGAGLVAQAPVLDIKMGLWERSTTTSLGPGLPPRTTTEQECLTKEQFDKDPFAMPPMPGMTCKNTVKTNTRTVYDATVTCTGGPAMNGEVHVQADSPSAYKATMKMTGDMQGQSMTVTIAMTGKWIGAACGNVK
jgi:hypothetical protein